MEYVQKEQEDRTQQGNVDTTSPSVMAFGSLPEALNESAGVQAQLKLDRVLNQRKAPSPHGSRPPTAQMAYGPKSVTTEGPNQTIADVDIHRPGTRPNVSGFVSGQASSSNSVYRHFTNWATMRDALAEKYVGLPLAEATQQSRNVTGSSGMFVEPPTHDFMAALKLEMNYASQAGAMGDAGENEFRNTRERSAEADAKRFPASREHFQTWIASQLDVGFVPGRTPEFNVGVAAKHILYAMRAIRYRARRGGAGYAGMAESQTVEDVILGTERSFGQGEILTASLISYLGGQGINVRTPIAAQDLWQLEEALAGYTPERQEQYRKLTYVHPVNNDRLTIAADLDVFPDEDAEEKYYDMMADIEMSRLNGDSSDSNDGSPEPMQLEKQETSEAAL